jgi:hypothetical protein
MFDDDENEDMFKPYEYKNSDLEDLCDTLMERMNDQYSMGELEFSITSLTAKNEDDTNVRIDCNYAYEAGEFEQDSSISFTIPSYIAHEPLDNRIYDSIIAMA